jgi:outer membrane receptor protein involved in Fe transport
MKIKNHAYLVAGSALLFAASQTNAALEEIVVTATKRAETIQDVPVSVAAVSADMMDKIGIADMEDLSMVVPNFEINSAAVVPNLYIRGLGGGLNHSIEQSVGRFVDDVYISRGAINLHPFMDVASVEVLRGPQGTLFGKNTAAGALIIHTNDPTEDFEAGVNVSYGQYATTGGVTEINGFVSGGLSDNVSGRLAFLYKDREGFYENQAEGPDGAQREDIGLQAKLKMDVSDATSIGLKVQYMDYESHGTDTGEMSATGGPPLQAWQGYAANAGVATASDYTAELDWKIWSDCSEANAMEATGSISIGAFCPGRDMETTSVVVDVEHEVDGGSVKFIAAHQNYDYAHRFHGLDGGLANVFRAFRAEEFDSFSSELRFTSEESETFDYIAGLYYEDSDIERNQDSNISFEPMGPYISKHEPWTQATETIAAFAQGRWYFTDRVTGIFGARWSSETKDFSFEEYMTPYGTMAPILKQSIALRTESRDESKFTPSATLQVDVNDEINVFATYSVGHKTGGFSDRVESQDGSIQYDAELIDGIELGMKGLFLDDALSLNVTFYHMSIEGLQLSTQVPSASEPKFKVGNAADSTSKGIEVESNWAVNDSWTLGANYAYTDATYDEYLGAGDCGSQYINAAGVCDLSGATLQYAPENKASAYMEYFADGAVNGWDLNARIDLSYTDDHYTDVGLYDFTFTKAYNVLGASVRLVSPDEKTTVSLIGRNLGNEKINAWTAPSGPNSISAMAPPRHITLKLGMSF